jgi:hypothetical protein
MPVLLVLLQVMVDTVNDAETQAASADSSSSSSSSSHQTPEGIPLVQTQPLQVQQQPHTQQQQQQGPSAPSGEGTHLRFVLSPRPTPAAQLLVNRRLEALGQLGSQQQQQQPAAIEVRRVNTTRCT